MSEKRFDPRKFTQYKFKAAEALKNVLKARPPRKEKAKRKGHPLINLFYVLIIAIIIAVFIRTFLVQLIMVPSNSMEPTLKAGARIFVNKLSYGIVNPFWGTYDTKKLLWVLNNPLYGRMKVLSKDRYIIRLKKDPARMDVIAFKYPAKHGEEQKIMIKRIIGLPNEQIKIRKGQVYINGRQLKERHPLLRDSSDMNTIRIPYGYYFVLGDNRQYSLDSRSWGVLDGNNILGEIRP